MPKSAAAEALAFADMLAGYSAADLVLMAHLAVRDGLGPEAQAVAAAALVVERLAIIAPHAEAVRAKDAPEWLRLLGAAALSEWYEHEALLCPHLFPGSGAVTAVATTWGPGEITCNQCAPRKPEIPACARCGSPDVARHGVTPVGPLVLVFDACDDC